MRLKNFIAELKRRNVFRVAIAYAIAGWLIIQVVSTIAPQFNFPNWVPPFVTILVFCGFLISLIIAWAFEITPEGVKKSNQVDITTSVTARTGKKLNNVIITVLALTVLFLGVERIFFATSGMVKIDESKIGTASIAVLPFVNMSNDKDNEFFSDGLSEELLNVLAQVENIHVAGRTSSFKFKGHNENLTTIGNELNVDNILEGSVQKSQNRIKITAQLIKVSDGFHLWSETYERELNAKNVFAIQEEISKTVLKELKIRLLPEETEAIEVRPTENIEAYNAFLEANQLITSTRIDQIEKAIEKYQKAIALDPKFSNAYARLANAHRKRADYGNIGFEESKAVIRLNIDKALLLNGNLGRAYDALGRYYLFTNESELALQTYERAIELLPNDGDVLDGYHLALEYNGQYEEAEKIQKRAYDMDPLNANYASHYANHISSKDPEGAMKIYDQLIKRYPENSAAYFSKAHKLSAAPYGALDEAFELTYTAFNNNPNDLGLIIALYSIASDLKMDYLTSVLSEKIERLYPKNSSFIDTQIQQLMYSKKYAEVSKFIKERSSEMDVQYQNFVMSVVEYKQGRFKEAKGLLEELNPEFKKDTISITNLGGSFGALDYAITLKKSGDMARYKIFEKAIFDYRDGLDKEETDELEYSYAVLNGLILTDMSAATKLFEDLYFNKKDKIHTPSTLELQIAYDYLSENDSFRQLKSRLYADLDKMSTSAVNKLKAKGIWRQELEMDRVKIDQKF
tara:strand:- start:1177 stop:3408 length:2232 start_codon:yes stop_codon:yes gene_type:complete